MRDAVFLTGMAGFIGSHVADRLCRNYDVIGLDNLVGGYARNVPDTVNAYKGSCLNAELVEGIFAHYSPRFVIHCAAMAAENLSHNCRCHTYQNNLLGETTIRNAAIRHKVECMVSLSSIAVMGHQTPPFTEDTAPAPCDPYGISKYAGEMDAHAAHEFFGLNHVIFRPHNVIGTRQNLADRYRNVAAIFCRCIREGKPLPIFGDGLQTRAFSPVSYVADIIAASIETPEAWNQTFNVGSDEPMTIYQLKELLEKLMKKPLPVEHHEFRKEAVHAHMTHEKVRANFPLIQQTESVEDVLSDMLEEVFSRDLPPMQAGPEIEIEANLPAAWKRQP